MSVCMYWRHIRSFSLVSVGVYLRLLSPLPGACPQSLQNLPLSSLCLWLHFQFCLSSSPPQPSCLMSLLTKLQAFIFKYQRSIQAFDFLYFSFIIFIFIFVAYLLLRQLTLVLVYCFFYGVVSYFVSCWFKHTYCIYIHVDHTVFIA